MRNLLCILVACVYLISCTPVSRRAVDALNAGNQCEFCRLSEEAGNKDPYSTYHLGLCYKNGWCTYSKNDAQAAELFTSAARRGVPEAASNLRLYGIEPPVQDLKSSDVGENIAKVVVGLVAVVLFAALFVFLGKEAGGSGVMPPLLPDDDLRGCCSYHGGIAKNIIGDPNCDILSRRVICKDGQFSPTCTCN